MKPPITLEQVIASMNIDPNNEFQVACAHAVVRINLLPQRAHQDPGLRLAYELFSKHPTPDGLTALNECITIAEARAGIPRIV